MQHGSHSTNGSVRRPAISSSPFLSPNQRHSSPLRYDPSDGGFINLCPSIFSPNRSPPPPALPLESSTSVSLTPSSLSCEEEDEEDSIATHHRLYLARLTLKYEEMVDRYELCLSHLQDTAHEAEGLRQENANLRVANNELTKHLTLLSGGKHGGWVSAPAGYHPNMSIVNEFDRLCLRGDSSPAESSPTSVLGYRQENRLRRQITMPKSISIRSSGYLKAGGNSNRNGGLRVTSPVIIGSQKVFVPVVEDGGKKTEREAAAAAAAAALELDVYNQGTFKTELCNKWQETGACPYGEQCQFAHGVGELRPVIRHPRYKTEVCRMILTGGTCPYGHRCHFRHALSAGTVLFET